MCRCQILFAQVNCAAAQQQQQKVTSISCVCVGWVCSRALTTCTQSIFNLIRWRAFTLETCVTLAHNYHVLFFLLFSHGLRRECDNYIALLNMRRFAHWRSIRWEQKIINKNRRQRDHSNFLVSCCRKNINILSIWFDVGRHGACCLCGFSRRIWTHLSTENGNKFFSSLCLHSVSDHTLYRSIRLIRCCVQCSAELIFYHLIRKICKCQFMFVVSHAHTGEWMKCVGRRCQWSHMNANDRT